MQASTNRKLEEIRLKLESKLGPVGVTSLRENALHDLERVAKVRLKGGRNMIFGYPVDIDDKQSPDEGLALDPVDRDAATGLMKALRSAGLKPSYDRASNSILLK